MSGYRFTIRFLILLTAVIGVALAVMRYPTRLAATAVFSVAFTALTAALIGAFTSHGRLRAHCIGFAVAGWIHAVLAFTPWFGQGTSRMLISLYILERLAPVFGNQLGPRMFIEEPTIFNALLNYAPGSPPDLYYKYLVIGQSLFTLAVGALGGCLGSYLHCRSAKSDSN